MGNVARRFDVLIPEETNLDCRLEVDEMAYDVQDFQEEVIQKSFEVPVLVDFWAEWCGPCRALSPALERLAQEPGGTWMLAKVNTEEHPEVAEQYQVRSIPTVKLFVDGNPVNEFIGALPERSVKLWLEKAVPGRLRKDIERAQQLIAQGKTLEARQILEEVLGKQPNNVRARILLAQLIVLQDPPKAERLVENIDDHEYHEFVETVRTIARLDRIAVDPNSLPDKLVRALYREAVKALFAKDFDTALQKFIELIRKDRYYDDDGSRKACVAIFKILGEDNEITQKHRREFTGALYV